MDESGVEPETFRMLSERATNYATRPVFWKLLINCSYKFSYKIVELDWIFHSSWASNIEPQQF